MLFGQRLELAEKRVDLMWRSAHEARIFGKDGQQRFLAQADALVAGEAAQQIGVAVAGVVEEVAEILAGDDAPPRGRGLVLLPPLPHGATARGRHAQARRASVR